MQGIGKRFCLCFSMQRENDTFKIRKCHGVLHTLYENIAEAHFFGECALKRFFGAGDVT